MSRFKSPGWKTPSPSRAPAQSSSIRGKISAPIPIPDDDDEFPIRTPGAGIATPLGHEGIEKQLMMSPAPQRDITPLPEEEQVIPEPMEPTRAAPEVPPVTRLSYDVPARQTTEVNLGLVARDSTATPASELNKPERKKSTLRSVFGRLFGKKRKSGGTVSIKAAGAARHAQHHSVSRRHSTIKKMILIHYRTRQHCAGQRIQKHRRSALHQCQLMSSIELCGPTLSSWTRTACCRDKIDKVSAPPIGEPQDLDERQPQADYIHLQVDQVETGDLRLGQRVAMYGTAIALVTSILKNQLGTLSLVAAILIGDHGVLAICVQFQALRMRSEGAVTKLDTGEKVTIQMRYLLCHHINQRASLLP